MNQVVRDMMTVEEAASYISLTHQFAEVIRKHRAATAKLMLSRGFPTGDVEVLLDAQFDVFEKAAVEGRDLGLWEGAMK